MTLLGDSFMFRDHRTQYDSHASVQSFIMQERKLSRLKALEWRLAPRKVRCGSALPFSAVPALPLLRPPH